MRGFYIGWDFHAGRQREDLGSRVSGPGIRVQDPTTQLQMGLRLGEGQTCRSGLLSLLASLGGRADRC